MSCEVRWIRPPEDMKDVCPAFKRKWRLKRKPVKAELTLTALGVYCAYMNGRRVGDQVLAPGWTAYEKRLQYQTYDVTDLLLPGEDECLEVIVGKGWYRSPMGEKEKPPRSKARMAMPAGLYGRLVFTYTDGSREEICTDTSWECSESPVRFSEIYDGEVCDASFVCTKSQAAAGFSGPDDTLIPQEGEKIREQELIYAKEIIRTPSGEIVVDFGQEITGYVEFDVNAHEGDRIRILHGEVLDAEGNFYRGNYRSAKAQIDYICREGQQTWHPLLTFFAFRYIKLEKFPKLDTVRVEQFRAIAVYSDMERTGRIFCSDRELNQFFSNVFWGQKCNFLDVPTDCPQRDERLGWTGDAQVFVKAASYNFNVKKFFMKWLRDMKAEQGENGLIPQVIPDYLERGSASAAWGDAVTICPWQLYLTYGDLSILREMYKAMGKWVDYIGNTTSEQYLWTGGEHFGDWLGLDAPSGSYKGSSRDDLIASAFYANSVDLYVKAGKALGEDMGKYEELYSGIVQAFRRRYSEYRTQTEYVLALCFGLSADPQRDAALLAEMIRRDGSRLQTGFVGTPYLLHALSRYGYTELAYTLLLRREYPSWLYSVRKGATTVWEHWDGIMEDGSFWSDDMNSFNHYAYGAAADWVYEVAAGIRPLEEAPGFRRVKIAPHPDPRLEWLGASLKTQAGEIESVWRRTEGGFRYEISTPVPAEIEIGGKIYKVKAGRYTMYSQFCGQREDAGGEKES